MYQAPPLAEEAASDAHRRARGQAAGRGVEGRLLDAAAGAKVDAAHRRHVRSGRLSAVTCSQIASDMYVVLY